MNVSGIELTDLIHADDDAQVSTSRPRTVIKVAHDDHDVSIQIMGVKKGKDAPIEIVDSSDDEVFDPSLIPSLQGKAWSSCKVEVSILAVSWRHFFLTVRRWARALRRALSTAT